jgi:hypothetical protein
MQVETQNIIDFIACRARSYALEHLTPALSSEERENFFRVFGKIGENQQIKLQSENYFSAEDANARGSTNERKENAAKSDVLKVIKFSTAWAWSTATSRAS